ncbi:MAG: 1-acyl-sn-glycerol-3-phosphate acyltransferase [Chloroflexi bacterium]|nr:1-acyl-sn-glycerol-3-phosphate acyltransferase [Chloroflexota bacterium]
MAKRLIRGTFDLAFWTLTRRAYYGLENTPQHGPFLIVVNHLSIIDPPFVYTAFRLPDMVVLAADKYKTNLFMKWIVETIGGVWINRGSGDRGAMKAALDVLKQGKILGMAPEGTRSSSHALIEGKTGAAFIAAKVGVQLLPVVMTGTEKVYAGFKRLRRTDITLRVGPAFTLPPLDRESKTEALEAHTHEIMCRLAALLPEDYHGVYRGDPRIAEIRAATPPLKKHKRHPKP